ncbi:hypothetical protein HNV12_01165 [Methanococcoides sp. SA1]|nr:hypothetical protein [Methanococcoides sp. SA1]
MNIIKGLYAGVIAASVLACGALGFAQDKKKSPDVYMFDVPERAAVRDVVGEDVVSLEERVSGVSPFLSIGEGDDFEHVGSRVSAEVFYKDKVSHLGLEINPVDFSVGTKNGYLEWGIGDSDVDVNAENGKFQVLDYVSNFADRFSFEDIKEELLGILGGKFWKGRSFSDIPADDLEDVAKETYGDAAFSVEDGKSKGLGYVSEIADKFESAKKGLLGVFDGESLEGVSSSDVSVSDLNDDAKGVYDGLSGVFHDVSPRVETESSRVFDYFSDMIGSFYEGVKSRPLVFFNDEAWNDVPFSGVPVGDLIETGKGIHNFADYGAKEDGFFYGVNLSAEAEGESRVSFENDFEKDGLSLRVKQGFRAFGKGAGKVGANVGAAWEKWKAKVFGDAYYGYDYEFGGGISGEVEMSEEGVSKRIGFVGEMSEGKSFSEEYAAFADVSLCDLSAGAGYSHSKSEEESETKGGVLYGGAGLDKEGFFVSADVGLEASVKEGVVEKSRKGVFYEVGVDGVEKEIVDESSRVEYKEQSLEPVYGLAGGVNVLDGSFFDVDAYGWMKNYPDGEEGVGGVLRSDRVTGHVNSSGKYSAALKLFGDGLGDVDFRDEIKNGASFDEEYVSRTDALRGKDGLYLTASDDGERREFGARGSMNGYSAEGGVVENKDGDGFYGKFGVRPGVSLEGSYVVSDDELSREISAGVEIETKKGWKVMAGGRGNNERYDVGVFVRKDVDKWFWD